jgi:mono/diheme cytochrome c family protein
VGRSIFALVVCLLAGTLGCWEQWSNDWFPQMKWQRSVQAFERPMPGANPLTPPDGTVPAQGFEAPVSTVDDAEANALVNPEPMSVRSLENGRLAYERFCAPCHGTSGRGDGPVSMTGPLQGPIAAVLPLTGPGGLAKIRSDGHIYTTIRYGRRRMPNYSRIEPGDRWDIVNWLRYLDGQRTVAR